MEITDLTSVPFMMAIILPESCFFSLERRDVVFFVGQVDSVFFLSFCFPIFVR